MHFYASLLITLSLLFGLNPAYANEVNLKQNAIIAINIALDTDASMSKIAETANARLIKNYPQGFSFDGTHRPHITLLQGYVSEDNLESIYAAVGKILADVKIANLTLKATNYGYSPWNTHFLGSISVERTDALCRLQQNLIGAIAPFLVKAGTAAAFFTKPDETGISQATIDYVANYASKSAGQNFKPHITVGVGLRDFVLTELNQPFSEIVFSPASVAIYQIGNFGTARKKLKEWKDKP